MTASNLVKTFIGSSDALLTARAAIELKTPMLILAADAADAERLATEINWFEPSLRVCRLPDWETLPYDHFSPHPDLVSERIATLYRFAKADFDIGIVPVTTAMTRLAPREYLAGRAFFMRVKTTLDLEKFRNDLAFAGYNGVKQVMAPGEFAIRGGLIDLFPMGSTIPCLLYTSQSSFPIGLICSVTRLKRFAPLMSIRSAAFIPRMKYVCSLHGNFHSIRVGNIYSANNFVIALKATPPKAACIKTFQVV
jgi:hypothetical protein